MKIFLDSANVAELKEGVAMGLVDGCTTNPSLIAKEKRPFRPLVEEICSIVPGDVSLEVVAPEDGVLSEIDAEDFMRDLGIGRLVSLAMRMSPDPLPARP